MLFLFHIKTNANVREAVAHIHTDRLNSRIHAAYINIFTRAVYILYFIFLLLDSNVCVCELRCETFNKIQFTFLNH